MNDEWNEEEYASYLEHERHMYAWCLRTYGDFEANEADQKASSFYGDEPANALYRGLVFHNEAWHWAMLHIFGEAYWTSRPDLLDPPQEYLDHSRAYDNTRGIR
jgi:hypothetical protein